MAEHAIASYSGNETRRCEVCGRDVELDALKPGWTVVRVDDKPVWSCPGCSRPANARRLSGATACPGRA